MNYSLHLLAEQDLRNAAVFYRDQAGQQVADRLFGEFERVAQLLARCPGLGTPMGGGRWTFPLRVFPYAVVYRQIESGIRVIVVRHQHRKPNYGGGRR